MQGALLQNKILTADNVLKRGWPHDQICKLCGTQEETPVHLCKSCDYTVAVWIEVAGWLGLANLPSLGKFRIICGWWRAVARKIDKRERTTFNGSVIYFWCNVRKERY
uniref:Reverse transcriptase zinc-binding domain-containing protein n=1 Tax=Arundo donax TaxID=35708 RepID=A0A0A9FMF9_ARUDO